MAKQGAASTTRAKPKAQTHGPRLFLGCFHFNELGERDRSGTFQMVVEAPNADEAAERYRARLKALRDSTTLFSEPTTLFLSDIIELRGSFTEALLVNYDVGDTPPEPDARICCAIPEQDHDARAYGPKLGKDGLQPTFLDFGGEAARKALEKAQAENGAPIASGSTSESTKWERERERLRRQQEKEAAAGERRKARAARERGKALAATLKEVGSKNRRGAST